MLLNQKGHIALFDRNQIEVDKKECGENELTPGGGGTPDAC